MRLAFRCHDPVVSLPRALDHIRRMGIDLNSLSARAGSRYSTVEIDLAERDSSTCQILTDRIGQISGVHELRLLAGEPLSGQAAMS